MIQGSMLRAPEGGGIDPVVEMVPGNKPNPTLTFCCEELSVGNRTGVLWEPGVEEFCPEEMLSDLGWKSSQWNMEGRGLKPERKSPAQCWHKVDIPTFSFHPAHPKLSRVSEVAGNCRSPLWVGVIQVKSLKGLGPRMPTTLGSLEPQLLYL